MTNVSETHCAKRARSARIASRTDYHPATAQRKLLFLIAVVLSLAISVVPVLEAGADVLAADGATITIPSDFPTIQMGIDAAQDGDRIIVLPGIYQENIDFLGKEIRVQGSLGPQATIIDGGNPSDPDAGSVVTFDSGESPDAILEGFTITGGTGTLRQLLSGHTLRIGGGILCYGASPTIRNNIVTMNATDLAGGIMMIRCSSLVTDNQITDNMANIAGGGIVFAGEPLFDPISGVQIPHGPTDGSLIPILQRSKILGNVAGTHAGGIEIGHRGEGIIRNNLVIQNRAMDGVDAGIFLNGVTSRTTVFNNTVIGNTGTNNNAAGQIHIGNIGAIGQLSELGNPGPIVANNIVTEAGENTVGISCSTNSIGRVQLKYNNVWNNDIIDYFRCAPGATDVSVDPLFSRPDVQHYSLTASSTMIDAGDPDPSFNDLDGTENDIGAFGGPNASLTHASIIVDPGSVFPDETITISLVITFNLNQAENIDYQIYAFKPDGTQAGSDEALIQLGGYETRQIDYILTLPQSAQMGRWRLIVVVMTEAGGPPNWAGASFELN